MRNNSHVPAAYPLLPSLRMKAILRSLRKRIPIPRSSNRPQTRTMTNPNHDDDWELADRLGEVRQDMRHDPTLVTLAFVHREALSVRQPYIWIISDTRHQAAQHLENIKIELMQNDRLRDASHQLKNDFPIWRSGAIKLPEPMTNHKGQMTNT